MSRLALILLSSIPLLACEPTRISPLKTSSNIVVVVKSGDRPFSRSKVVITKVGMESQAIRTGQTDRHGRVHLQDLPVGDYIVWSAEWPALTWWKEILVTSDLHEYSEVLIQVPRPKTIRLTALEGTIFYPGGAAMAGARVEVKDHSHHGLLASGVTDASGRFSEDLPRGKYELWVSSPELHTAVIPLRITKDGSNARKAVRVTMKPRVSQCGDQWNPYEYEIATDE
jgi:hypothetical protein